MMNAPAVRLAELEAMLPGLESPSVIPLAHDGMIAIHAVVGADEVWGLVERLLRRKPGRRSNPFGK
jgi:ATP phosphoribosyltransferase